ncbi:MAG: COG1361 S-layer family protein [Candidatus Bathyarchaeia archaeon]
MLFRLNLLFVGCVLLVSLLAVSGMVPSANAQLPEIAVNEVYWGSGSNRLQPEPGDVNVPLTVVVRNVGQQNFLTLTATLSLENLPFTSSIGEREVTAGYGTTLQPGQNASIEFLVNIASEAKLQSYNIPLTVNVRTLQYSNGVDISMKLPVELKGKVSLNLEGSSRTVKPGTNSLAFSVENKGTATATDVEATVSVPSPLVRLDGDNVVSFDSVAPNARVSREIVLFAPLTAIGSGVKIPVSLSYKDAYGNSRQVEKAVGVVVTNQTVTSPRLSVIRATWGDATADVGVSPGDKSVPLFVTIQNLGSNTLSGLEASLLLGPPFSDAVLGGNVTSTFAADVKPGQTTALRFALNVAPDAPLGTHTLRMILKYLILNDLAKPTQYLEAPPSEFDIPVAVGGKTKLEVTAGKSHMDQGSTGAYPISIKNAGTGDIRDLELTLTMPQTSTSTTGLTASQSTRALTLLGSESFWHFDVLPAGKTVTVSSSIATSETSAGNYVLTLTLTYLDPLGKSKTETRTLGLSVKPRVVSSLVGLTIQEVSADIIRQGTTFNIEGAVQNLGDSIAQAVSIRVITPQSFSSLSPTTVGVGDLTPGESKKVHFTMMVSPSASTGVIHQLDFSITYSDYKGDSQSSTASMGIPIHGSIELITYEVGVSPISVAPGGEFEVALTLLNKGTVPAFFTNVSLTTPGPFIMLPESTDYLGQVDPDAPVPTSLVAKVDPSTQPGDYPLRVEITFKDEFHILQTESIEMQITVVPWTPAPVSQSSPFNLFESLSTQMLMAIVAVVVAAASATVASVYVRRKRTG